MKKIPIIVQIFLVIFTVMVIPVAIITYYSSNNILKYSEAEIADSASEKMNASADLNEMALSYIIRNIIGIVQGEEFSNIKNVNDYNKLISDYSNVDTAMDLLKNLTDMKNNDNIIQSAFFYLDDSDYIISTDKGILRNSEYDSIEWMEEAKENISGISGAWIPRKTNADDDTKQKVDVVSFVYRISKLTSSTKGTIVVNIYEKDISDFLNTGEDAEGFIVDESGNIVADSDKNNLYTNVIDKEYVSNIINSGKTSGYTYTDMNDSRYLIVYRKATFADWYYISVYSMEALLLKTNQVRQSNVFLTILVVFVGTVVSILMSIILFKPIRELAKDIRENEGIENTDKNELVYIKKVFEKVKEQEHELHRSLESREADHKNLMLKNLLEGEIGNSQSEIDSIFPYSHYIVAIISIDNKKNYLENTSSEGRGYNRLFIQNEIARLFCDNYVAKCVNYDKTTIAAIINMKNYDQIISPRVLREQFDKFKVGAKAEISYSFTIGISYVHTEAKSVKLCMAEALSAYKQKLIKGNDSIIFYNPMSEENTRYFYPYNSEKKIINYLNTKEIEDIKTELNNIALELKQSNDISTDNILLIFNQLIGATIKYLVEHNINTNKVFKNSTNIYTYITSLETLDEIEEYLAGFYESIIMYTKPECNGGSEIKYSDQIISYINEHYKEDIMFEDIAEEIGISYSYLRKLVKTITGKSLIDYVNLLRIEEVKRLLLHSDLNISEIAYEVGYRNVQSVNRFFKKYEGISPREYKNMENNNAVVQIDNKNSKNQHAII